MDRHSPVLEESQGRQSRCASFRAPTGVSPELDFRPGGTWGRSLECSEPQVLNKKGMIISYVYQMHGRV